MAEMKKVTIMVLKVDLQCSKCYKKVKKVLCKFPQIQDQVYDEKNNTVNIKVVCCSPEKLRDKICCKGRGSIKSIEILPPPEPKPAPKLEPKSEPKPEPKPAPAPKPVPAPGYPPVCLGLVPVRICCTDCQEGRGGGPCYNPCPPPPAPAPAPSYPPVCPVPVRDCCTDCQEGRGGGPCYNPCYGRPVRYYDGYCGRPVYDSWGGGGGYRGYSGSRCSEYFSEENSQGCTLM